MGGTVAVRGGGGAARRLGSAELGGDCAAQPRAQPAPGRANAVCGAILLLRRARPLVCRRFRGALANARGIGALVCANSAQPGELDAAHVRRCHASSYGARGERRRRRCRPRPHHRHVEPRVWRRRRSRRLEVAVGVSGAGALRAGGTASRCGAHALARVLWCPLGTSRARSAASAAAGLRPCRVQPLRVAAARRGRLQAELRRHAGLAKHLWRRLRRLRDRRPLPRRRLYCRT